MDYYISRKSELVDCFEKETKRWRPILTEHYGKKFAENILLDAKDRYETLIPEIPYIGGEENHLTSSFIGSVECLAFYQAMKARGKTAVEAGKVLYEAIASRYGDSIPEIPPSQRLSEEELMRRREERELSDHNGVNTKVTSYMSLLRVTVIRSTMDTTSPSARRISSMLRKAPRSSFRYIVS